MIYCLLLCLYSIDIISFSEASLCSTKIECDDAADNFIGQFHASSEELCQVGCSNEQGCEFYTWCEDRTCLLLSGCNKTPTEDSCMTGPAVCPSTAPTSTTNHPQDCSNPTNPDHGRFDCDPNSGECHLLCEVGYVTTGPSAVSCTRDNKWTVDPRSITCEKAVLLVTGGDGALAEVELYTRSNNSCNLTLPRLPNPRNKHSVDWVNGHVVLCGGYTSESNCLILQQNNTWTNHSHLNHDRYSHVSSIYKSDLYLIGGPASDTIDKFEHKNQEWQEAGSFQDGTDGCAVSINNVEIVVTGGHGCEKCAFRYNLETGVKTQLSNMHDGRTSHGCTFYQYDGDDYVLVAGGWSGYNLRSSEVLNLRTNKWRVAGDLSEGRRGLQLTSVEGGLLLATGGRIGTVSDKVESFDTEMELWSLENPLKHRRSFHAVTPVPASRFNCNLDQ